MVSSTCAGTVSGSHSPRTAVEVSPMRFCRHWVRRRRQCSARRAAVAPATSRELYVKISISSSTGKLDLGDMGLRELPPEVLECTDLEELSLAGNELQSLPDAIGAMTNLKRLGLAGNQLRELPATIGHLQQLEGLWAHGNQLQSLPPELGSLTALEQLSLSGNCLQELPATIGGLQRLQDLGAAGNRLASLPASLGSLSALRKLSLHGNQLASVPEQVGQLQNLQELWLMANSLAQLPATIAGLQSLKELSVADNHLEALPSTLPQLPALQKLWLYNNALRSLPGGLPHMPALSSAWLEANPLPPAALDAVLGEAAASTGSFRTLGLDEAQGAAASSALLEAAGQKVKVGHVAGGGATGYFKLQRGPACEEPERGRALVVAFGSAPGVPNWGGLLGRAYAAVGAPAAARAFDVLYVVDAQRSWYSGGDEGYHEYEARLRSITQQYCKVVMIGDSMGATGALLFCHLASAVLAFCPQVDLQASSIRPAQGATWMVRLQQRVLHAAAATGGHVAVHCGNWQHDLDQANTLADAVPSVHVKVHAVTSHRLALYLDSQRRLLPIVQEALVRLEEGTAGARPARNGVRLTNFL